MIEFPKNFLWGTASLRSFKPLGLNNSATENGSFPTPSQRFPEGFLWGSATSAHQVEGGNFNDWTEWEKVNAKRLAQQAEKMYAHWMPVWYDIKDQAQAPQNYISGRAGDHYNRYEEDFDIAKSLGHKAHRFSLEWSRIEPEEGKFDEKEIEHYRQVIKALRERGIEPFVSLWHWTLPVWLAQKGGFENRKISRYFRRYVDRVSRSLADVTFWITLNEPLIISSHAYLKGSWPPQQRSFLKYWRVINNLASAHQVAYEVIWRNCKNPQVGIAKNNIYFEGWLAPLANWWWNQRFLNKISRYQDFICLNYYFHNRIKGFKFNQNENKWLSDMGWEIYPEGIYHVLKNLRRYKKPIYITENGVADAGDIHREKFIKEHLRWVHKAIGEDVDVKGYFYWSLLDNFEWDKGFWPRFGLVEIDYKTFNRTLRPSARSYAEICRSNILK